MYEQIALGFKGSEVIGKGESTTAGETFFAFYCVHDTVTLGTCVTDDSNSEVLPSGTEITVGETIYGMYSSIAIGAGSSTDGKLICYKSN
jgi:hypothetical protein